ncbi:RecB-like exonuclease/helicase [Mycobacterium phage Reindeer]|uniref:RecB-like exonuclease/helicase n=1 Tax=Mycobacterium phage Reindeer TaxID=2762283 RepID=A0A7G8LHZ6_9CAUD|nr:exonuclease [Mycobacterium phage Reindeer]QNJ56868.1 RecB-like exonuclease/helicase [Mycobacterium phage Reindeer]
MLFPPEGGNRVAYSRCSTLAKDIDKASDGLFAYYQANAMLGLAANPSLMSRVKAILAKGGNWDRNKGELKEIAKNAEIIGGSQNKADRGTSIHDFAEAVELDTLDWSLVPEDLKGAVDGYHKYVASSPHIKFVGRELFLAVNVPMKTPTGNAFVLRAAGSADRIVEIDGKRYMADIKTGRDDQYRMGVSGQLALYTEGQLYQDSVVRQNIDWAEWYPNADGKAEFASHECDYEEAVMLHCPQQPDDWGRWQWKVLLVPLERGRQIIRCGQWARKLRYVPAFREVRL